MKTIKPYSIPPTLASRIHQKRFLSTWKWLKPKLIDRHLENVLDIGGANEFGMTLAGELGLLWYGTCGNLNFPRSYIFPDGYEHLGLGWEPQSDLPKFDCVFCFEVIEHIANSLLMLVELRKYITTETMIFFSYPSKPKFLWPDTHFHEYDKGRFVHMLDTAGYGIRDHKRISYVDWGRWWRYFKGLRTPLRLYFNKTNLYELRMLQ